MNLQDFKISLFILLPIYSVGSYLISSEESILKQKIVQDLPDNLKELVQEESSSNKMFSCVIIAIILCAVNYLMQLDVCILIC